jgi:hypothetical protein
MKRYWQFLLVGIVCMLVALLWAQPPRSQGSARPAQIASRAAVAPPANPPGRPEAKPSANNSRDTQGAPLPGSSSSLPLLAVIGFGVLAGGITSALRTR